MSGNENLSVISTKTVESLPRKYAGASPLYRSEGVLQHIANDNIASAIILAFIQYDLGIDEKLGDLHTAAKLTVHHFHTQRNT